MKKEATFIYLFFQSENQVGPYSRLKPFNQKLEQYARNAVSNANNKVFEDQDNIHGPVKP